MADENQTVYIEIHRPTRRWKSLPPEEMAKPSDERVTAVPFEDDMVLSTE